MGFATWIIHLICRLCSCRWGWPQQFIADTHLLFPRYFFSHRSIKGAIRIQMGHVEFRCHSFFFVAHLAGWSSLCLHQHQMLVFRQLFGVFGVTRFICRLRFCRWMWSIFIAISGVSHFIRISLRTHRRRAQLTGDIRTHLSGCIRTHHLEHLPVTLEVVDTRIKVTCFTWGSAKYWA